ncbi:hypothetical protein Holit_03404 [Hollandina sp. SP2]
MDHGIPPGKLPQGFPDQLVYLPGSLASTKDQEYPFRFFDPEKGSALQGIRESEFRTYWITCEGNSVLIGCREKSSCFFIRGKNTLCKPGVNLRGKSWAQIRFMGPYRQSQGCSSKTGRHTNETSLRKEQTRVFFSKDGPGGKKTCPHF